MASPTAKRTGVARKNMTHSPSGQGRLPPSAPSTLSSDAELAAAIECLRRLDPGPIEAMLAAAGPPPLRKREPGLAGLAWIVISQQVSTASARAIFGRFIDRFPACAAAEIMAAPDEALRGCGLSSPKIRTMRALAGAMHAGDLDLARLASAPAEAARAELVRIKGIGPWSADIYLLFCLGAPDVWPTGDLALQEAARLALGLPERPDARALEAIGERWRPWRAAAARLLWAYYGAAASTTDRLTRVSGPSMARSQTDKRRQE